MGKRTEGVRDTEPLKTKSDSNSSTCREPTACQGFEVRVEKFVQFGLVGQWERGEYLTLAPDNTQSAGFERSYTSIFHMSFTALYITFHQKKHSEARVLAHDCMV